MHTPRLASLIKAALDPVMTESVFAPGQDGQPPEPAGPDPSVAEVWPAEKSSILWCAGYDDLHDQHPHLPQALDQDFGSGACVDLMIETDSTGRITRLDLENLTLAQTFDFLANLDEGQVANDLLGHRMQADVAQQLRELFARLLEVTKPE